MLELGSGGGNNASYLKKWFDMTLVDRSKGMIECSRKLNPECEHVEGDMRTVRLQRTFDRVFIHDAIMHMTSEAELMRALRTAFAHTRPGGATVVAPDCTRETYSPITHHGGNDLKDGRIRSVLREKIHHLRTRAMMPSQRVSRAPIVLKELLNFQYHRYSRGLFSAAKDLLL